MAQEQVTKGTGKKQNAGFKAQVALAAIKRSNQVWCADVIPASGDLQMW